MLLPTQMLKHSKPKTPLAYSCSRAQPPFCLGVCARAYLKMVLAEACALLENVDDSSDSGPVTVTKLNGILKQIPGCGNCEENDVSSWLDCDADDVRFQLMSDDEIIAQVRKPNSDDENSESDEE
ncbi:hypothetical protein AVEN_53752-1 [Araneus ventricosus]|uniref:Uncharacterized protein n=1 Tax=Araneus ventricosus TaxID=182803 RepID=A0A4Y2MWI7_ARAVE|nr:hypothetical protein AVEN_53752-1 [Araneus ventricosus]